MRRLGYDLNHTIAPIQSDGEWGPSVVQAPAGRHRFRLTDEERVDMERICAAWNACASMTLEEITGLGFGGARRAVLSEKRDDDG